MDTHDPAKHSAHEEEALTKHREHSSTRLIVDQRTDPSAETIPVLVRICVIHAVATILAIAAIWIIASNDLLSVRGSRSIVFPIMACPAVVAGMTFRRLVSARPTPGFTSKAGLIFSATNCLCAFALGYFNPSALTFLEGLVPVQQVGLIVLAICLSWLFSICAFHLATRTRSKRISTTEP